MVQSLPPNAPAPRLCTLQKTSPDQEYGYNLHAEKNRGQFVGMVDKGSVADIGGLRTGDRIFAINGHSIVGESHKKVVDRIKQDPTKCEMLVATEEEAKWYSENNIPITLQLPNIVKVPGDHTSHRGSNANNSPPPATWYAPGKPADPVFVAPPPPQDNMDHPLPIICVLNKNSPSDEFGFNLHAEKGRGHFIGTVDADGIGDCAGLRLGQRIVGVNGTLVYPNTPHKEVVALIKRSPMSTTLLLASEDVDQWYKQHNEEFSFDKARKALEPVQQLSPHSIQISDEEILEETPSPAPRHEEPKVEEAPPLSTAVHYEEPPMAQYDLVPDSEIDIMAAVFGQVSVPTVGAGVAVHEPEPVAHEQAHLIEHHGHQEPALKADPHHFEEHHEAAVPAYNAYASPPASVVPHHHQEDEHYVHHDDHYHADYNHNGHSHDHYHNGKSNGYSSNASDSSDLDIFHLSAKEARERLRQQKKRAQDMSLEEKYRLVSNM